MPSEIMGGPLLKVFKRLDNNLSERICLRRGLDWTFKSLPTLILLIERVSKVFGFVCFSKKVKL